MKKHYLSQLVLLTLMLGSYISIGQPTSKPTDPTKAAADVISIYGNTFTNVTVTDSDPNWGQSGHGQVNPSYDVGGGDLVLAYPNFNYQGTVISTFDASGMEFLHVDVWVELTNGSTTLPNLQMTPIGSGETLVALTTDPSNQTLTAGQWESFDIPVSSFTGVTLSSIVQFKFDDVDRVGNVNIYIDNLYFWKSATDPATIATLSDIKVDGTTIADFSSTTESYDYEVAAGTTVIPTVTVATTNANATNSITAATSIPGTTTVLVTSDDESNTKTYSINFVINTPSEAAPVALTRQPSEVVSIYANGYTDASVTKNWAADAGGATYELVDIAGRSTHKYTNVNYAKLTLGSQVDVSQMTHVHFDYWTPNATKIGLNINGAQKVIDNSDIRKWSGFDMLISDITSATMVDGFDFLTGQIVPHDETLFIDNFYFYKAELPTTPAALSKYCETEVYHLNITDGSQAATAVKLTISNIDATSMFIELESGTTTPLSSVTIDAIEGVAGTTVVTNNVYKTTFTFTNAPATIAPVIQWNNGANQIIRMADVDGSLPFSASCTPPAALNISTSSTTTGDVSCGDLNISSGVTYTVAPGNTLSVIGNINGPGELIVSSGASLITYDGKNTGNATIKRNTRYADGKYSFVGSPVASGASITGSDLGSIVYMYDETTAYGADGLARWKDAATTQLMTGKGYAQAMKKEISFTGVPNDGTITVTGLSHTAPDANHGEHGWNLLSNPYPAAIDVTKFLTDADNSGVINGSVYIWDDNGSEAGRGDNADYLTVNSVGEVGGPNGGIFNGYIGSMQGFFVKVSSPTASADVVFKEGMRVGGVNKDATFFRKDNAEPLNIRLSLETASGFYNELLVGLRADATVGIDRSYDASKLISNQDLQFYSLIENDKYAIQGLPLLDGVYTELAFNLAEASEVTLSVSELTGLEDGSTIILTDRVTSKSYDLSETSSITFSAAAGTDQNRFTLSYGAADVLNIKDLSAPIYRYLNGELSVRFATDLSVEGYAIYDLTGRSIVTTDLNGELRSELVIPNIEEGIRIIRIVTSEGTYVRKFLF